MSFSDDELSAYLDGSLPIPRRVALETDLETDPALEARLRALDPLAAFVDGAFDEIPAHEPKVTLPPTRGPWAGGFIGLAAGLALGVGLTAAWLLNQPPAPLGWKAQVAAYQKLYSPATLAGINISDEELGAQIATAGAAINKALDASDLQAGNGLDLLRAQVLGLDGRNLIQLVYKGPTGEAIALCLIENAKGKAEAMASVALAGLESVAWSDAEHSYLLIGGQDRTALESWAQTLRTRL